MPINPQQQEAGMAERRDFEMTQADLDGIMAKINAARSTPLIMLQCGMPRSAQEVANDAWAELGGRMGFDAMTVERGRSDRHFSAVATTSTAPSTPAALLPEPPPTLLVAACALGAMPEGYCFCSSNRIGDDSKVHEPECRDLRAAIAQATGEGR